MRVPRGIINTLLCNERYLTTAHKDQDFPQPRIEVSFLKRDHSNLAPLESMEWFSGAGGGNKKDLKRSQPGMSNWAVK